VFPEILRVWYVLSEPVVNYTISLERFVGNDLVIYYYCIINEHKEKSSLSHIICCCIENENLNNGVHREVL
jgi:hypothetical protein